MKDYIHEGIVKANGFVDSLQPITDPLKLKVAPADHSFQLVGLLMADPALVFFNRTPSRRKQ